MVPPVFGPFRGSAQGRAQGSDGVIRKPGGGSHKQRRGDHIPPFPFSLPLFGFVVLDRTTRTAPAERERTGATPPFSPLARFGEGLWITPGFTPGITPPPPSVGSLPSSCIPAGRLPLPARGQGDETHRAAR